MFIDHIDDVSINELEEIANRWAAVSRQQTTGKVEIRTLSETGVLMAVILPVMVDLLRLYKKQKANNE